MSHTSISCPDDNKSSGALTRRTVLVIGVGALATTTWAPASAALGAQDTDRHGLSIFGDLKYPADFHHLDYVDPRARKGGTFSLIPPSRQYNQNLLTFNSLNSYILKGDAAPGMQLTFATLMRRAADEPDAVYGLAARAVRVSSDGLAYRYVLRPEATFHDGSPLTAHDVAFSLDLLKQQGHPNIAQQLRDLVAAEALDDHTVAVRFAAHRGRDVPLSVTTLPIFSRAYYGKHPFDESTLETPLGSGSYKVGRFEPGRYIEYERVRDWWGADLPITRGQDNFDVVRFEFYRDRDVAFEGFAGKNYLFRFESNSRIWATHYNFPAVRDGRVKREILRDDTPSGGQGWLMNLRRRKFSDSRVREAFIWAFDFEWTNKTIMYDAYRRVVSLFQNSDMVAVGKPTAGELALLEPLRDHVPAEVFGEPFMPPVSDGSGRDRNLLRHASQLLDEAGLAVKDGRRLDAAGEPFTVEFLIDSQAFEPHHMPFIRNLATLGIEATLALVDAVQYRARVDQFDFEITFQHMNFGTNPGESLRPYFSSAARSTPGSHNLAGIADPALDALIEKVIAAQSRPELVSACRALDRVFRARHYWIPQWYLSGHWIAYWDVFSHPSVAPHFGLGVPDSWWYDPGKAARIDRE
jgi:microcin C transport system substrate-binding protein